MEVNAHPLVNIKQLRVRKYSNKTRRGIKQMLCEQKGCCDESIYWTAIRRFKDNEKLSLVVEETTSAADAAPSTRLACPRPALSL